MLRKSSLVSEISGLVDTQAVEQLFSSCKKDLYFINNLSPTNHVFVFRLICHLRNKKKNFLVNKRQLEVFGILQQNVYGQICGGVDVISNNSYNSGPTDSEEMSTNFQPATGDIPVKYTSRENDCIMQSNEDDSPELPIHTSSISDVLEDDEMASYDPEVLISTGDQAMTTNAQQPRNPQLDAMRILQSKVCPNELFPQWR